MASDGTSHVWYCWPWLLHPTQEPIPIGNLPVFYFEAMAQSKVPEFFHMNSMVILEFALSTFTSLAHLQHGSHTYYIYIYIHIHVLLKRRVCRVCGRHTPRRERPLSRRPGRFMKTSRTTSMTSAARRRGRSWSFWQTAGWWQMVGSGTYCWYAINGDISMVFVGHISIVNGVYISEICYTWWFCMGFKPLAWWWFDGNLIGD